jgi:hypothetical protein
MYIAPPPNGLRIQDAGDSLIVRFRPPRLWGVLMFLAVWPPIWTWAGTGAFAKLLTGDWSERAFFLVWVCGWAFGESMATGIIAWQFFGRELLVVIPEQVEVRKEVGRFARTKLYDVALIRNFRAVRVPSGEDEQPRKDFCLEFGYKDRTVHVGEGMSEREAEHITASVLARIRTRSWWREESPGESYEPPLEAAAPAAPRWRRLQVLTQIVLPIIVLAGVASLLVMGRRDSQGERAPQPTPVDASPRGPVWPPPEDQFASMRV